MSLPCLYLGSRYISYRWFSLGKAFRRMRCRLKVPTCRSFCGFQSESKMTQVSAAVRLMPRPPARVHSRKTKRSESGLLKRSMAACRRLPLTRPSIRSYRYLEPAGMEPAKVRTPCHMTCFPKSYYKMYKEFTFAFTCNLDSIIFCYYYTVRTNRSPF